MQFEWYEIVVRGIEFKVFFEILTIGDSKILMFVFFSGQNKTLKTWWTTDRVLVYHNRKFRPWEVCVHRSVVSKVCRHVQMYADYSHDTSEPFRFEPNIFSN